MLNLGSETTPGSSSDVNLHKTSKNPIKKKGNKSFGSTMFFTCAPCDLLTNNQSEYKAHLATNEHRIKMINVAPNDSAHVGTGKAFVRPYTEPAVNNDYFCPLCNRHTNSMKMFNQHIGGKEHQKNLLHINKPPQRPEEQCKKPSKCVISDGAVISVTPMGKRATIIDLIGEQRKVLNQKKAEKVQGLIFEPKNQPDTWGIRCDVCDLPLSSKFQMAEHLKGNRHKKNLHKREKEKANPILGPIVASKDYAAPTFSHINAEGDKPEDKLLRTKDTAEDYGDRFDFSHKRTLKDSKIKMNWRLHSSQFKITYV